MCDTSRGLQSQQNNHQLHVRIHQRLWDAQKHLLPTLVKLNKMIFDNSVISSTAQQNVYIISKINFLDLLLQQRVAVATKRPSTTGENSSQILGCSKTSTSNSCSTEEMIFDNNIISLTVQQNVFIISNIYSIELRLKQKVEVATKRPSTKCENSSQILGCSKTSTSNSCSTEEMIFDNNIIS